MKIACAYCGNMVEKSTGDVNRALKVGLKLFCNKVCFGMNRRKPDNEKREIKRLYDIEYREKNKDRIQDRKTKYERSPAGRAMQKRNRDKFKQNHLEYCRTESYKKYKQEYDKRHIAKKNYGEYWESSIVLNEIEKVIEPEKLEVKIQKGIYNKSQKRKRLWNSTQRTLNKYYGTPYRE